MISTKVVSFRERQSERGRETCVCVWLWMRRGKVRWYTYVTHEQIIAVYCVQLTILNKVKENARWRGRVISFKKIEFRIENNLIHANIFFKYLCPCISAWQIAEQRQMWLQTNISSIWQSCLLWRTQKWQTCSVIFTVKPTGAHCFTSLTYDIVILQYAFNMVQ